MGTLGITWEYKNEARGKQGGRCPSHRSLIPSGIPLGRGRSQHGELAEEVREGMLGEQERQGSLGTEGPGHHCEDI